MRLLFIFHVSLGSSSFERLLKEQDVEPSEGDNDAKDTGQVYHLRDKNPESVLLGSVTVGSAFHPSDAGCQ